MYVQYVTYLSLGDGGLGDSTVGSGISSWFHNKEIFASKVQCMIVYLIIVYDEAYFLI